MIKKFLKKLILIVWVIGATVSIFIFYNMNHTMCYFPTQQEKTEILKELNIKNAENLKMIMYHDSYNEKIEIDGISDIYAFFTKNLSLPEDGEIQKLEGGALLLKNVAGSYWERKMQIIDFKEEMYDATGQKYSSSSVSVYFCLPNSSDGNDNEVSHKLYVLKKDNSCAVIIYRECAYTNSRDAKIKNIFEKHYHKYNLLGFLRNCKSIRKSALENITTMDFVFDLLVSLPIIGFLLRIFMPFILILFNPCLIILFIVLIVRKIRAKEDEIIDIEHPQD